LSAADILNKLNAGLPLTWFGSNNSTLNAILTCASSCNSIIRDNITAASTMTRLKTMSASFCDLAAYDFMGDSLPRINSESDNLYINRLMATIFSQKVTYNALVTAINVTMQGYGITIYEFWSPGNPIQEEDNSTNLTKESSTTTIDMEPPLRQIPQGSYPVGLKIDDAAARYGTNLGPYESLVIITGAGAQPDTLSLENNNDLVLEDGSTLQEMENIDFSLYQYLFNVIMRVKPIGTTVWVSIT
jgi:hypothetical protein